MSSFDRLPPAIKITTPDEARALCAHLASCPLLAFDTETTGLSRQKCYALILSLSDGIGRWAIWPEALPYFQELLENPRVRLIGHNANFDQWMLLNVGIDLNRRSPRGHARVLDTMVMHALLDDAAPHDLKYLSRYYLGIEMVPFKQVYGLQMRTRTLEQILLDPINEAVTVNYSALDAYATYKLFRLLQLELERAVITDSPYENLWDYYLRSELLYTKVLWEMEREGIALDRDELLRRAPAIELECMQILNWFCRRERRFDVNINSGPQMHQLFFKKLGHKPITFTEEGAPQLSKAALKTWSKQGCEYSTKLLRYRDLSKQLSTYVVGLLDKIFYDGKVHATFVQTGARTGRLAAREPNLQNQPPHIRSAYVAAPGTFLYARDFAQLEMRILAHVSGDETLIDAINTGKDVHAATAANMFKVPYERIMAAKAKHEAKEELSDEETRIFKMRAAAKTINFGIMYGMGPSKLARELGVTTDEAKEIIKQYFDACPKIQQYFARVIADAYKNGFCRTVLGRRRQVTSIWSPFSGERARAERQVKNAPIQGFASEITKLAMLDIHRDEYLAAHGVRMLIQVHDEIVFKVPLTEEHNTALFSCIADHMSNAVVRVLGYPLKIALDTSGAQGATWAECK